MIQGAGGQDQYLSNIINNPRMAGPVRNYSQVPLGTVAYRKTLASVPDHSVNIASIGMPTNLRDLLQVRWVAITREGGGVLFLPAMTECGVHGGDPDQT